MRKCSEFSRSGEHLFLALVQKLALKGGEPISHSSWEMLTLNNYKSRQHEVEATEEVLRTIRMDGLTEIKAQAQCQKQQTDGK